jgi:hypothetical protein
VPEAHLVAVADAPPTIEAALKMASDRAAIYYPFMDLLLPDPYAAFTNKVLHAFYIGPSGAVGGVPTEAVAWATNDVFIQMWVGTEDKLPRRIRAMFAADPLKLRHDMTLSNWQIDPTHAADTFGSQKAQGAAGKSAHGGLILYQQHHAFALAQKRLFHQRWLCTLYRARVQGEIQVKGGPLPQLRIHKDEPARLFDDAISGRQAQARAFAQLFGGVERFKDFGQKIGRNACSGVGHMDHGIIASGHSGIVTL